jgi:phage pi2 protein 07
MKSLHLLVEKHKYQYLILASLILIAWHVQDLYKYIRNIVK